MRMRLQVRIVDRRLALSIGGERRIERIHSAQWARAARELGLPEDALRERGRELVDELRRDAIHLVGARPHALLSRRAS
jgi:hypothetical protein